MWGVQHTCIWDHQASLSSPGDGVSQDDPKAMNSALFREDNGQVIGGSNLEY